MASSSAPAFPLGVQVIMTSPAPTRRFPMDVHTRSPAGLRRASSSGAAAGGQDLAQRAQQELQDLFAGDQDGREHDRLYRRLQ